MRGLPDWVARIDWADLEAYLAKHWAFLDYLEENGLCDDS